MVEDIHILGPGEAKYFISEIMKGWKVNVPKSCDFGDI